MSLQMLHSQSHLGIYNNDRDMHNYIQSTEDMVPIIMKMAAVPALKVFIQTEWVSKLLFPSDKSESGAWNVGGVGKPSPC
jgi:hypothetical protein